MTNNKKYYGIRLPFTAKDDENFFIDIVEQFLNGWFEHSFDKISECAVRWCRMLHKIDKAKINFTGIFKFAERDISICHKSE